MHNRTWAAIVLDMFDDESRLCDIRYTPHPTIGIPTPVSTHHVPRALCFSQLYMDEKLTQINAIPPNALTSLKTMIEEKDLDVCGCKDKCRGCGDVLQGRYCHGCKQQKRPNEDPALEVINDLEGLLSVTSERAVRVAVCKLIDKYTDKAGCVECGELHKD